MTAPMLVGTPLRVEARATLLSSRWYASSETRTDMSLLGFFSVLVAIEHNVYEFS